MILNLGTVIIVPFENDTNDFRTPPALAGPLFSMVNVGFAS